MLRACACEQCSCCARWSEGDCARGSAPAGLTHRPLLSSPVPSLQGHAARGSLAKLTVEQLKGWLRAKGLKLSGAKGELVARIKLHLGIVD